MFNDYVIGNQGFGVGAQLAECRFDPGMLRPYYDHRGQKCVTLNTGKTVLDNKTGVRIPELKKYRVADLQARGINSPVFNAGTALQKDAWIEMDRAVVRATRQRLTAWTDLAASSTRGGFNGMGKLTYEYQAMTDAGEAVVDMDGLAEGRNDNPVFNLHSIPLPITHSDFWFSSRQIAVSRNTSTPLDTTMAEQAGRRVAEMIEKTVIGVETGMTFGTRSTGPFPQTGTSSIYGYTNFPYRVTKTDLNTPTGANPDAVMTDVLEMVETMQTNGYFGPYMLYMSTGYSRYLNDDYFRSGSTSAVRTLRERIMEIEGIQAIRRLDYLTSGFQMILVNMDGATAQAINGLEITTVQWESQGGMRQNFKVLGIKVPLLRTPYSGVGGVIHGTTS